MRDFSATILHRFRAVLWSASCLAASAVFASAQPYRPDWESLDKRPTPAWFEDAKYGIFIHWGVYSVPAWAARGEYAEWYWQKMADKKPGNPWWEFHRRNFGADFEYPQFAPQFRAELFDPEQWVDLFVKSGAKYVVPTTKHHDGFALWPSAEASRSWNRPWNSVEVGPKRDLIGDLEKATRARGLKFGIYYSLYEWFHPLWLGDRKRYVAEHMMPQFKDVVTRYRPSLIFSDGEWDIPAKDWRSEELLAWLFNESPCRDDVVVNDRWGKGTRHRHGGYHTTEYTAGLIGTDHPWEESRGMAASYGLSRAERATDYKSSRELILLLVDIVSRGGNLLLDIGPAADGTIPPLMEERLLDIGAWLKVNGEAIYGTRPAARPCQWTEGSLPQQKYGEHGDRVKYELLEQVGQTPLEGKARKQLFFTSKGEDLYAVSVGWPVGDLVVRDAEISPGTAVTLLGHPGTLRRRMEGNSLVVTPPVLSPDGAPSLHAHVFRITGARLKAKAGPR
jgi:alpha-L-fucosidase